MNNLTPSVGFRDVCEHEFAEIHVKLDRLDEAIRGNGKPGIALRLDRLERDARRLGKLVWLLAGSAATALCSAMAAWAAN